MVTTPRDILEHARTTVENIVEILIQTKLFTVKIREIKTQNYNALNYGKFEGDDK